MYICKYCGKEFETPPEIGGHVLNFHKKENACYILIKKRNEEEYIKNPKHCEQCNEIISYELMRKDKNRKFCSHSCSASSSNKRRRVMKKCLYCEKEILKSREKRNNIFCNQECSFKYKKEKYVSDWLNTGELPIKKGSKVPQPIREYILKEQNNKCAICEIEPIWNDKPLLFVADHINGNSSDCSRDNIRLICHNCDSQTETYKGRNKGNGRYFRRERYQLNKSY